MTRLEYVFLHFLHGRYLRDALRKHVLYSPPSFWDYKTRQPFLKWHSAEGSQRRHICKYALGGNTWYDDRISVIIAFPNKMMTTKSIRINSMTYRYLKQLPERKRSEALSPPLPLPHPTRPRQHTHTHTPLFSRPTRQVSDRFPPVKPPAVAPPSLSPRTVRQSNSDCSFPLTRGPHYSPVHLSAARPATYN
jgi:hypothetical protein